LSTIEEFEDYYFEDQYEEIQSHSPRPFEISNYITSKNCHIKEVISHFSKKQKKK